MRVERAEINLNPGEMGVLASCATCGVRASVPCCPKKQTVPCASNTLTTFSPFFACFYHPVLSLLALFSYSSTFLQPQQVKGDEVSHFSIVLRISLYLWHGTFSINFPLLFLPSNSKYFIILVNILTSRAENQTHSF